MAEHLEMKKTTPQEFLLALVGGLFAPLIAIVMIIVYVMGIQGSQVDAGAVEAEDRATRERIQPFGVSLTVEPTAPKAARSGEAVYKEACAACHDTGALGAPKFKDAGAWAQRLAKGYDTLLRNAIQGINNMPPRGGNVELSDLELARAIVYMADVELRGEKIYKQVCASCHDTGALGAPRFQDENAWSKRLAEGYGNLFVHAIKGIGNMPARGGANLSDVDVASAMVHLTSAERSGEQVYNEVCAACHGSGALGAPKLKDTAAWSKRIARGYDALLTNAIKGIGKMPARGGDPELTDMEVARAVVHMTNSAGAKFEAALKKEPEPTAEILARGKAVYANTCAACHDTGATGAQKLTDADAWRSLIRQGKDYLYKAAIEGTFGGPPRGGNDKLSDAEVKAAVDYMVYEARRQMVQSPQRVVTAK